MLIVLLHNVDRYQSFIMKCSIIKLSCLSNFFVAFIISTICQYPAICLCCRFINASSEFCKQLFGKIHCHIICGQHAEIISRFLSSSKKFPIKEMSKDNSFITLHFNRFNIIEFKLIQINLISKS